MGAKLSCAFVDAYGRITRKVFGMEDQVLLADYAAAIAAFVAELTPMTDLGLVRADLILPAVGEFAATAGANVDVGATISGFLDIGGGKKASLKIPGIKASFVGDDGSIDLTQVDVAAYLAMFETDADFNISDGEQVSSWIKGALDR